MCKKIKDKKKNPVQRSSKNNDSFKTATIAETVELETDKNLMLSLIKKANKII